MKISIIVDVEDEELIDADHSMGITGAAYDKLTGIETGRAELGWLGSIEDVEKIDV